MPTLAGTDTESWIEISYRLSQDEWDSLADKYKLNTEPLNLRVRRYFRSSDKDRDKSAQSNLFGYVNGQIEKDLFYGAKNVGAAKLGQVLYIPALTTADEQTKLTGPSPLRDVINFLLKKVVVGSPAYSNLLESFKALNDVAKAQDGFLDQVAQPLNAAIADWNITIDLSVNFMKPEEISKNLVSFSFVDKALGNSGLELTRYGHGFQRTVIYELIRLASSFKESKDTDKKEFTTELTLVLFEEPEAFLHPAQQENMAHGLHELSTADGQQIVVCTHSPTFSGKAADELLQLVRIEKVDGTTRAHQLNASTIKGLFSDGSALVNALTDFVKDPAVHEKNKIGARKLLKNPPSQDIADAQEKFRLQLWLDGEKSSLFFSDRVLLVEGPTERTLFNFMLANDWKDLRRYRICVVDVLGKYNFHRYMALMRAFQIPFGIILDDDNGKSHHQAVNDLIDSLATAPEMPILAGPEKIVDCLETLLGLQKIDGRNDMKPVQMLAAVSSGHVDANRMAMLRDAFKRALALN